MTQKNLLYVLPLCFIFLTGCLGMKYNKWIGKHQSNLIRRFGPPDRTASDGNNGQVLVYYDKTHTTGKYNPIQGYYIESSQPSVNFFTNSRGIITNWNVRR